MSPNNYSSGSTEIVYDDYSTIEQALNALDTHKTSFKGWVSAVLDNTGAAKFIVINDATPYTITDDDGPTGGGTVSGMELVELTLGTPSPANDTLWSNVIKSMENGLYQSDYRKSTWAATVDPADVLLVKFVAAGTSATLTIRDEDGKLWYAETQTVVKDTPYFISVHIANGVGHYGANASGKLVTDGALPQGTYKVSVTGIADTWTFTVR